MAGIRSQESGVRSQESGVRCRCQLVYLGLWLAVTMTPAAAPLLTTVKGMKGVGTVLRNRITGTWEHEWAKVGMWGGLGWLERVEVWWVWRVERVGKVERVERVGRVWRMGGWPPQP